LIGIHLVGASGVGKSTLFKSIMKDRSDNNFKTIDEIKMDIVKENKFKDLSTLNKIIYILLQINILPNKNNKFANRIIRNISRRVDLEKYNCLFELLLKKLEQDNSLEYYNKAKLIKFYLKKVIYDYGILEYNNTVDKVLFEDGIIHNNRGFSDFDLFKQVKRKYPNKVENIIPNAIIYCELSLKENIKRRKKRIKEGNGTFVERDLNEDQITLICKSSLESSKRKIEIMEKEGVRILKLNMKDDLKYNTEKAIEFIKSIDS